MDPPSYGRGPKGEIWKIEESVFPFIELTEQLLSGDALFFLINSYIYHTIVGQLYFKK